MTNTHGGSRPVTRSDDKRKLNPGGARPGAGPKPKSITLKLGGVHFTHARTQDGKQFGGTMMLEVTKIERDCIELTDQHTGVIYHIVR